MLAGAAFFAASAPCYAAARRPELARKAYLHAVELQQALEAKPAESRTKAEYERAIREFRDVYLYDFSYVKAPAAAEAIGDLYTEMGMLYTSPADFRAAIKAYDYVISQYPASSMARDSWVSKGKVYLKGLDDPDQAADTFRSFLDKHPSASQSAEARKNLKEIADAAAAEKARQDNASASAETPVASGDHTQSGPVRVTDIRDWVGPNYTRVVIGAQGPFNFTTLRLSHPDRIVFDLPNTHLDRSLLKKKVPIDGDFLRDIRVGQFKPDVTRIVLDVKNIKDFSAFPLPNPFRLIIDVRGSQPVEAKKTQERQAPASPAAGTVTASAVEVPARENTPLAKPALAITKTKPEVVAAQRIEQAAHPKTEAASRDRVPGAAKPAADVASAGAVNKSVTAKSEAAPGHAVQRPATSKTEAASGNPVPQPSGRTTKAASSVTAQPAAKRTAEVASVETKHREIPFSAKPASPTEDGSQTLTRALGLKVTRIVIDPGHGGFDTGTIGPTGLEEKDLVLDVALRLQKLLETETDARVFMTRSTDKFIPLEERTAIANEKDADLFISIHANASRDHHVRGIETYFLNFTSDPDALNVAARENATSQESVHQLQDLIEKIALNNKIEESQELARDVQTSLYKRMARVSHGLHNRGVRKAPFVVLIGANMPSILAEISFLSNPHSEHLLRESSYREDIAKALFKGIEAYINNLGSVRVAQRTR